MRLSALESRIGAVIGGALLPADDPHLFGGVRRGVDLGAIDFIHRRLLAERDAGRAVLLVSSELSEILALSDRILVLFEGRIVHETTPGATDERTLGLHMTGRATHMDAPLEAKGGASGAVLGAGLSENKA